MSNTDDDIEEGVQKILGLEVGYVVERDDPEGLGRVRVCIPGLIEPFSAWALPLGTSGGGSKKRGLFAVPEIHAEVGVFFKRGNPENPYYLPANWGRDEVAPEAQGKVDNRVFSTETFAIEIDETEGSRCLRLSCRKTGDKIELNAEDNTVSIQATTALNIKAVGAITIDGLQVTINGRQVAALPDPI